MYGFETNFGGLFMEFFKNKWVRRAASFLGVLYLLFLLWLDYMSAFYTFKYTNVPLFAILYILVSAVFLVDMIYTRDKPFTAVLAMFMMVAALPLVLFEFGNWLLIIPPFVVAVTAFFACRANETLKMVMGTMFLLMYILGGLGFFIMSKLFITQVEKTVIDSGVSTNGIYRYEVLEVKDNSTGGMQVKVEPNDKDKDYKLFVFVAKGYDKIVYRARNHDRPVIRWDNNDTLYINNKEYDFKIGEREFTLN